MNSDEAAEPSCKRELTSSATRERVTLTFGSASSEPLVVSERSSERVEEVKISL
jgi:hypothetical protein